MANKYRFSNRLLPTGPATS